MARGQFSFSKTGGDLAAIHGNDYWKTTPLVAAKDGYGFAISSLAYFDSTDTLAAEWTDNDRRIAEYHYGSRSTMLTLVRDDVPIRGRVLDSEGQPVLRQD